MTVPTPAAAGWVNGAPVPVPAQAERGAGTGQIARLVGIDFARFLAILGMMCAHLLLQPGMPGHQAWVSSLVDGNASTLFAVIGGISVILATRRYLEADSYAAAACAMAARGVLVIALGATLAMLPVSVVVVLVYFGVAMLCTIPFLRMPVRWLLVSAALIALVGPFVTTATRGALDVSAEAGGLPWTDLGDPALAVRAVFVTGTYPVITWLVYLLVGMALARLLLAARRDGPAERRFIVRSGVTGLVLTAVSLGASRLIFELWGRAAITATTPAADPARLEELVGQSGHGAPVSAEWWWLLGAAPHTGTIFDVLRGIGVALLVIALMLAFARWAPRWLLGVLRPMSAAGAAPLTIYTVHVLGVALTTSIVILMEPASFAELPWWYLGWRILAVHVVVVLAIGAVLALLGRRGPLEAFVSDFATWAARIGSRGRAD
ncbi:hypothetical protein ASC66_09275 [Leifsonia sp. Root4]|uniref:heparan-alpha-glucosaminide N-acetyltransferase domain-containing protein n=1 Tax=Leifsonia sp. Root4 TaxID=1736525 RepID=UPI0006F460DB|nr:heparan-alpha-glucosaminide N-acetyltransferase domain-containing protein [Leifsonia sp. Root4]KQW06639.1 hypothetical protein ASC66_09275 [Leifsonia sp. Root4]